MTRRSREEAERIVADLRDELSGARKQLERGGLTAPGIDAVLAGQLADQRGHVRALRGGLQHLPGVLGRRGRGGRCCLGSLLRGRCGRRFLGRGV